jgi:hypothetical protein
MVDRLRARSRIAAALCNLGEFRLYLLPATGRLMARSVMPAHSRGWPVPEGAQLVGVYAHGGIRAPEVLEDVDALLATLARG